MKTKNTLACLAALIGLQFAGSAQAAATLIHDYQLNGSLADALGGPSLVSLGGDLTTVAGRYKFGANQGLKLTGGLNNTSVWSMDFRASYDSLSGTWKKLVDFQNLSTDAGLYFADYGNGNGLQYYPSAVGPSRVNTGTDYTVALTRDSSNVLRGYVNGALQWALNSSTGSAAVSDSVSVNNILTFFTDDFRTSQGEAKAGSVDFIRIYDGVLTDEQVRVLDQGGTVGTGNLPEPASLALSAIALMGVFAARKRRSA